jgi:flagellar motor protein MotB
MERTGRSSPTHAPTEYDKGKSEDFSALRRLLLSPEQVQLDRLRQRLDTFVVDAQEVSRVLPDAIRLRARQDHRLLASMLPITQEALALSIKQSPQLISDSIAPILGSAIRKAISRAMREMLQSLNQTLEYSMSWQGLQWRWEAWKTGRPFVEVVLLHTLRFRVEQVFLIHKKTGLLLNHVMAEGISSQGEAAISGMLTAIQDFVRDSFQQGQDEGLESLRIGDLTVWIEQGSRAILATVIRGTPPVKLRDFLQNTLESFHAQYSDSLQNFQGDAAVFLETRPLLEDCLQAQFVRKRKGLPVVFWVFSALLLALLGWWAFQASLNHQQWTELLKRIGAEPGIVVTTIQEEGGRTVFHGLRDPLAVDPERLLEEVGYPHAVGFHFEPFIALTPEMIRKRAVTVLQPPESVEVSVEGSRIMLMGESFHAWISKVERSALAIPGISEISLERLIDTDMKQFEALQVELEGQVIFFLSGQERLPNRELVKIQQVKHILQELDKKAMQLGREPAIDVMGYSSPVGPHQTNVSLSERRANKVLEIISENSFRVLKLSALGKGVDPEVKPGSGEGQAYSASRRVSFKVVESGETQTRQAGARTGS